jgi:rRNA maturation protein Nop10
MLEHYHTYTPDEEACPECGGHVYEVQLIPEREIFIDFCLN